MTGYTRLKLTDAEAHALLTIGRAVMDDEETTDRVFSNGVDTSAAFRALGKLVEALAREKTGKKMKKARA